METWKDIIGYEGIYSVSSHGRIRRDLAYNTTKKGRILKTTPKGYPLYPRVVLSKNGKCKNFWVHSIVARAFIGSCPYGKYINHKDGIKINNHINNLEYVTPKENNDHARRLNLNLGPFGEKSGSHKLKESQVIEMRKRFKNGEDNISNLAKEYNIAQSTASMIINRITWRHI